jgi:hypothetical protein
MLGANIVTLKQRMAWLIEICWASGPFAFFQESLTDVPACASRDVQFATM